MHVRLWCVDLLSLLKPYEWYSMFQSICWIPKKSMSFQSGYMAINFPLQMQTKFKFFFSSITCWESTSHPSQNQLITDSFRCSICRLLIVNSVKCTMLWTSEELCKGHCMLQTDKIAISAILEFYIGQSKDLCTEI